MRAFIVLVLALSLEIVCAQESYNSVPYSQPEFQQQSYGSSNLDTAAYADQTPQEQAVYGQQTDDNGQSQGKTSYSSLTIPSSKGEILIHRPAPIIVKRPPTKVLVNHPPLVVKPAPVILHKPPPVVVRKVFVKHHPRPVKVEPVYVNVVKPPADHYYVNEKPQKGCNKCHKAHAPQPSVYKPVRNYEQQPPQQSYEPAPQNYEAPAYDSHNHNHNHNSYMNYPPQ